MSEYRGHTVSTTAAPLDGRRGHRWTEDTPASSGRAARQTIGAVLAERARAERLAPVDRGAGSSRQSS